jgi:hypothetical protein
VGVRVRFHQARDQRVQPARADVLDLAVDLGRQVGEPLLGAVRDVQLVRVRVWVRVRARVRVRQRP